MKKLLIALVVLAASFSAQAQEQVAFRFGCISFEKVMKALPEYANIETTMNDLKQKYDAEAKASAEEFNAKYEVFLNEQATYAPAIRRKRQQELEAMMQRNEQFRLESLRLLDQARAEMTTALRNKINTAVQHVATHYSLAFVLNTDSDAVPFMNTGMAYDITSAVEQMLQ